MHKINFNTHKYVILSFLMVLMTGMALISYLANDSEMRGGIVVSFFIILIMNYLVRKFSFNNISNIKIIIFIFSAIFILRLSMVSSVEVAPWNDFMKTLNTASQLAVGDFSGVHSFTYSIAFPNLLPWISFETILIKIFHENAIFILKILNCAACGVIGVCIYIIGRKFSTKVGVLAAGIYAFYPSSIVFSVVLSNQHISTALEYLSFAILLSTENLNFQNSKRMGIYAFAGFLIGIGQLIRPDALPALIATIIFISKLTLDKSVNILFMKRIALVLTSIVIIIGSYSLTTQLGYSIIEKKNIYPYETMKFDMGYKFFVGLNFNRGVHSTQDMNQYFDSSITQRKEILFERVNEYIQKPLRFVELSFRKFYVLWGQYSKAFFWVEGNEIANLKLKMEDNTISADETNHYNTLMNYQSLFKSVDSGYYFVFLLFSAIGVYSVRNRLNDRILIFIFWIILCYAGVFVFIEVQDRYRYFLIPILILLSSIGLDYSGKIYERIRQVFES